MAMNLLHALSKYHKLKFSTSMACRISKPHVVCDHGLLARVELACLAGAVSAPLTWRDRLIGNRWMQRVLRLMVVVAVGAIMGDGVLTPAISGAAHLSSLFCSLRD